MAPTDAERRGLNDGDRVRVWSQRAETFMSVRIDIRIKTGELFATFLPEGAFLNKLTSAHRDTFVSAPEHKVVAVNVERA